MDFVCLGVLQSGSPTSLQWGGHIPQAPLKTTYDSRQIVTYISSPLFPMYQNYGQPLNRVISGNYEYRVFLRCRHAAKLRFIKLRSDVLVKLQLLDNKRGEELQICICLGYMHSSLLPWEHPQLMVSCKIHLGGHVLHTFRRTWPMV